MKLVFSKSVNLKFFFKFLFPYFRIFICFILFIGSVLFISAQLNKTDAVQQISDDTNITQITSKNESIDLLPDISECLLSEERYKTKINKIKEQERLEEIKKNQIEQKRIALLESFLKSKNSPMAPYSRTIIKSCMPYGINYCRFFLSIAGIESGFGIKAYGYNAWGWGKMKFSSWNQSIPFIANAIASNYYLKGVNTFEKLAYSPYGPKNPESWIINLHSINKQIPLN